MNDLPPTSSYSSAIAFYIEQYREGQSDDAFHGLLELDNGVLHELTQAFHESTDTSMRAFLLNVIWQHRQASVIPLLAEALFDRDSDVWKEAIDGLVTLNSPESLQALRRARMRQFTNDREGQRYREWLEEGIRQAEALS